MEFRKIKNTRTMYRVFRAPDQLRACAIIGTVAELAEHDLIHIEGKQHNDMYLVLIPGQSESSPELYDVQSCKHWINSVFGVNAARVDKLTNKPHVTQEQLNELALYMYDDLREELHAKLAPCTPEAFLAAYVKRDPEIKSIMRDMHIELEED